MTKLEQAARQALGALEVATTPLAKDRQEVLRAITTLREALSGVQALCAAPAVPAVWKAVPVNPTPEMWKAAKTVPDPNPPYPPHYGLVWDAMLAASPTPTAEQLSANKAAPAWADQAVIEYRYTSGTHWCPLGPAERMKPDFDGVYRLQGGVFPVEQAAPKAAQGVGNSGFDHKTAADLLNNKTVSDEAVRKFVAASRWAHDERAALSATLLAMHGVLTSREAEIALLKKALLEAETATQEEAQEPGEIPESIERMATGRYKVVPSHESMFHRWAVVAGSGTQQLYLGREVECQNMARKFAGAFLDGAFVAMQSTAPQPAPAPLSDDVVKDAALWHWLAEYLVGTRTDLDDEIVASKTVNDLRKLVEAAIKQGGKA